MFYEKWNYNNNTRNWESRIIFTTTVLSFIFSRVVKYVIAIAPIRVVSLLLINHHNGFFSHEMNRWKSISKTCWVHSITLLYIQVRVWVGLNFKTQFRKCVGWNKFSPENVISVVCTYIVLFIFAPLSR